MRKLLLIILSLLFSAFCFAENLPEFSLEKNAKVFDSYEIYKNADTFRFFNKSQEKNFKLIVYKYSWDTWSVYGTAKLKDFGDSDFIDTEDGDVKNFRYFAFVLTNFTTETFDFSYSVEKKHGDFYISINSISDYKTPSDEQILKDTEKKENNDNSEIQYSKYYEFETDKPTIKIARLWVAETFNSAKSVIEMYDEELQTLVGTGVVNTGLMGTAFSYSLKYSFKIQNKNNIISIKFFNFRAGTNNEPIGPLTTGLKTLYSNIEYLTKSLEYYYKKF